MNPTPTRRLGAFATLGRAIRKDRRALSGALIMAVFVLIAIVGPALVGDPTALVGVPLQPPSWAHLLGTNGQGQDVLAQLVVVAAIVTHHAALTFFGFACTSLMISSPRRA